LSFFDILGTILLGPLKLAFEAIYDIALTFVSNPGVAIIFLSLAMNILVLPLYRRADAMQEEARDTDARLQKGVSHIKKTFSGDERMMILQTYYKQNNYKPTSGLKGSVSLLLEIPFFMAAYQFLSGLTILNGVPFGPIADLGKPDGLLTIGSVSINVLPFLMTFINVISSYLYLKGFPLKTKVQLYAMAAFFLVFLYTSPACLVFYWTLNNLFSLIKTICYKLKNPMRIIRTLTTLSGVFFIVYSFIYAGGPIGNNAFLFLIGFVLELPIITYLLKPRLFKKRTPKEYTPNRKLFILCNSFLTVLIGVLIPSAFIAASPQEYIDLANYQNPLWYIVRTLSYAAGTFLVWLGVFYWLANKHGKVVFEKIVWVLCSVTLINYMFFGTDLGVMSSSLKYENGVVFTITEQVVNIVCIALIAFIMYVIFIKFKRVTATVLAVAIVAVGGMSALNVVGIKSDVDDIAVNGINDSGLPTYTLSKNGKNIVVIMLDRAMGQYVPYIFNEKPELKDKFAGFTYYDNVISFGGYTNFGVPSLMGGYEYSPVEMNKRADESLVSKHNEALKVMPTIFANNGYKVTVCDPAYANYTWIPDLSIYDGIENVDAYITKGKFGNPAERKSVISNNHRNFFLLSLMKSLPLAAQPTVYDNGTYNQLVYADDTVQYDKQTLNGLSISTGLSASFMEPYNVLTNMSSATYLDDHSKGHFLFLANDTCHEPMLLQTPDYVPADAVDNTEYDSANKDRFVVDGRELIVNDENQMIHYHANMASLIQLGNWFDHLRQSDVYDNTRIILVSDHGRHLGQINELIMKGDKKDVIDAELYFPLLMVKDFNSSEYTVSHEFMTNADVPTLAMKDVINTPTNPFTGKEINNNEKYAHEQFVILSDLWDVKKNNGNTYKAAKWASVKDNIWYPNNWTFYKHKAVLDDYKEPQKENN